MPLSFHRVLSILALGCLGGFSMLGCGPRETIRIAPTNEANRGELTANQVTPNAEISMASWSDVESAIGQHAGKLVVVDIWSNYCPPCVKELPDLVELHRQHAADVACVTFNCSFSGQGQPEEDRDAALKILSRAGADCQNFLSREVDQDVYQKLEIAAVPVVRVYGRDGQLLKQFDNERQEYGDHGFTYKDHVIPYVTSLLTSAK